MKLKNYTNFINESKESTFAKGVRSYIKSKGIYGVHANEHMKLSYDINDFNDHNKSMILTLQFPCSDLNLINKDFYEKYTKDYNIFLSLNEVFESISFKASEVVNNIYSTKSYKIKYDDLIKTENNELRSHLGLEKYNL